MAVTQTLALRGKIGSAMRVFFSLRTPVWLASPEPLHIESSPLPLVEFNLSPWLSRGPGWKGAPGAKRESVSKATSRLQPGQGECATKLCPATSAASGSGGLQAGS
ncbi:unnamed protein product [Pleuronectes platessa]|uniref:Uncharacterized protein n=1 Tax=Pleuronectes platessa TaxID=8262 RepID=A0A9N7V906_PLEPL|nr:unnamed protein product [Pleuronectes platessa]